MKLRLCIGLVSILLLSVCSMIGYRCYKQYKFEQRFKSKTKIGEYWVIDCPTPNIGEGKNEVQGIILHHTGIKTIEKAVKSLRSKKRQVSSHLVIDKDGTRYVLAAPTQITWHAGYSQLNGRDWCNEFTVGIEFQGNTLESPLTDDQIQSALDYIVPLMKEYKIKKDNIVTHEFIRQEWNRQHPDEQHEEKVDITAGEYKRFMSALEQRLRTGR